MLKRLLCINNLCQSQIKSKDKSEKRSHKFQRLIASFTLNFSHFHGWLLRLMMMTAIARSTNLILSANNHESTHPLVCYDGFKDLMNDEHIWRCSTGHWEPVMESPAHKLYFESVMAIHEIFIGVVNFIFTYNDSESGFWFYIVFLWTMSRFFQIICHLLLHWLPFVIYFVISFDLKATRVD